MAGGTWQDRPPEGSIAASLLIAATAPKRRRPRRSGRRRRDPYRGASEAIEGVTVERCAYIEAALGPAGVPPAEYDALRLRELGAPAGR